MTFIINATVQDVSDGPAPIDVLLAANLGDLVTVNNSPSPVDAVVSNTEGKLSGVEIHLVFDEDNPPLALGQVITFTGHFIKQS